MAVELLRKQHWTLCYELPEDQPLNLKDSELRMWELPSWVHLSCLVPHHWPHLHWGPHFRSKYFLASLPPKKELDKMLIYIMNAFNCDWNFNFYLGERGFHAKCFVHCWAYTYRKALICCLEAEERVHLVLAVTSVGLVRVSIDSAAFWIKGKEFGSLVVRNLAWHVGGRWRFTSLL